MIALITLSKSCTQSGSRKVLDVAEGEPYILPAAASLVSMVLIESAAAGLPTMRPSCFQNSEPHKEDQEAPWALQESGKC